MEEFNDLLNEAPEALEEYISLPNYGDSKSVYKGLLTLQGDSIIITFSGSIYYSFAEKVELSFEGIIDSPPISLLGKKVKILAGDLYHGITIIEEIIDANVGVNVRGCVPWLNSKDPVSCKQWRWCYLNGPYVFGEDIRRNRVLSKDRLVFKDGSFEIIIENIARYNQQKKHREISHYCELRNTSNTLISKEDAQREILLFSRFFSFIAGCLHAPFFIEGLENDTVKCCVHGVPPDCSLVSVSSWKPDFKDDDLIPLWPAYRSFCNESVDKADILNTAIHWYLQANMNSGMLEGALLLGFTGIELISNEVVGRELNNEMIIQDFIQRLRLEIDLTPYQIAQTRNYLMHYKNEFRRTSYNRLTFEEKIARLETVLQILELAILYLLGYKGHYNDRLHMKWRGGSTKLVPWVQD